jgi:hypothetical protein
MAQPLFGTGLLVLTPTTAGVVTPIQVAVLKDISLDISYTKKDLIGNLQFPVDTAKGEGKLSGKAKSGYFAGGLISAILSGSTTTVGSKVGVFGESGTVPGTPYQITVAGSATWLSDLAVFDVTAQKFLTRVASAPATGQYSVAAGVYTFAATDTNHVMSISYDKTSAAVGTTIALTNQMMGTNTAFSLKLYNNYQAIGGGANSSGLYLPMVVIPKLSFAFKNNDFFEKSIDFEAIADGAGNIMSAYTGN